MMDAQELARKLIEENKWTLRTVAEDNKARAYPDPAQAGEYWTVVRVVQLAYGFNQREAVRFIGIAAGEV